MSINIDPNLLRSTSNNLFSVISALNKVKVGMSRVHGDIDSCWQSDYTAEYLEHFSDVENKISNLIIEVQNIRTALNTAAEKAEQIEKEVKSIVEKNS